MTTVALLVDPPCPGVALPRLADTSPLSPGEAADCYAALLGDVAAAVDASGGDLLVNYRPADALSEDVEEGDPLAAVRATVDPVVDDARYEVQVGETFAGRVGNTVTHLLNEEGTASVVALEPLVPFLGRSHVDGAAMRLRRDDVVLAHGGDGRVAFAGFAAAPDFADAYDPPAIDTLCKQARDDGLSVGFVQELPVVRTGRDLAAALAVLRARRRAGAAVPERFAAFVDDHDLVPSVGGDHLAVGVATGDTDND